jgi:HEAT repeat protein
MKKILKILLIVFFCFVVAYGIRIFYGLWILRHVSSSDQLKIARSAYESCLARGEENCESYLNRGIKMSLETQKKELMDRMLDENNLTEDRLLALDMFYRYCRNEDEFLGWEEAELYFSITNNKEESGELRSEAAKYLLQTKTKDETVSKLQKEALEGTETSIEYKRAALQGVAGLEDDEAIDALIKALKDETGEISVKAHSALIAMGLKIEQRIPQFLEISIDESESLLARNNALDIINSLAKNYGIKNQEAIEKLKSLIKHPHYVIRSSAAEALKAMTGKEYEIEPGTQEEEEELLDAILF